MFLLTTDKIVFPEVWPTDEDVAESRPDRMRDERVILFTSLHHNRLENKRKNLLSSDWLTDSPTILYYLIRTRRRKRVLGKMLDVYNSSPSTPDRDTSASFLAAETLSNHGVCPTSYFLFSYQHWVSQTVVICLADNPRGFNYNSY